MTMTKKDYEAIARALARQIDAFPSAIENHAAHCARAQTCSNIADHCAADNPRFDRARFLKACGVES